MEPKVHTELIGVLVGAIIENSNPIVISLYIRPDGTGHTRTSEYGEVCTPQAATGDLVRIYYNAVKAVWRNEFKPPWYYIQLCPGADPRELIKWALPWSATARWVRLLRPR